MIGRLVAWLFEALVLLVLVRLVLRFIIGATSRGRPGTSRPLERAGGTLVRDPQCGTYVPEARALRGRSGRETHYFCSTACRDAFERRNVAQAG